MNILMVGLEENIMVLNVTNMILTFGKFKGKTVAWVFMHQPSYLAWAVARNLIEPDKDTAKKLMRYMELENQEKELRAILDDTFQYDDYDGFDEHDYGQG